jgi:hypothetical protein
MKEGILHFTYFTTGDHVRTPEGVGVVSKDEDPITEENDFCTSEVNIQHKLSSSNNPGNSPIDVIRDYVILISPSEYEESKS